jgi:rubrerythrin
MTLVEIKKQEIAGERIINPYFKPYYDQDLVRMALIAELDATSLYQSFLFKLFDENARNVLEHIMNEEKEHISELQCLLMKLDEKQAEKMTEVDPSTCIADGHK